MSGATDDPKLPVRVINPWGPRVLVRVIPPDERSRAGLYLPATAVESKGEACEYGEVVEVARAETIDAGELEGANVSGIPHGAKVLLEPGAGYRVPWDDRLRLVTTKEVLAVVEEVAPEAIQ